MNTSLKLSIGIGMGEDPAALSPHSYTRLSLHVECHKQKIQEFLKDMREKTGKYRLPTIIVDVPESAKDIQLPFDFQAKNDEDQNYFQVSKKGRVYKCVEMLDPDFVGLKKKVEKIFSKLTELDNTAFLNLDLYNIDSFYERFQDKDSYPICIALEKAKIEANLAVDPQFFDVVEEITKKLAPKFADSPIMAMLPLFAALECDIEMDSLSELESHHKQSVFGSMRFQEPDQNEQGQRLKENFNNKDKIVLYFCADSLGYLKAEIEVRLLALFKCLH